MPTDYLYGTYGEIAASVAKSTQVAGTAALYVGTAPVNLVRGYKDAVNRPLRLANMLEAQGKAGYSGNWDAFTLCEAMSAHFDNRLGPIGPIYIINVLNPAVHKKSTATEVTLNFVGGRAEIKSDTIVLDTLALEEKAEDVDYRVAYNYDRGTVVISSVDSDAPISGAVAASYDEVDASLVTATDIIGSKTENGVYTGLYLIELMQPMLNTVVNLLAAPKWSAVPEVYKAMLNVAWKTNGHWYTFVMADIPLEDAGAAVDTIAKARSWKAANSMNGENSKLWWPKAQNATGQVYHLSTLATAEQMRTDSARNDVPMETCANKAIPVAKQYFGPDSPNMGFDQQTGNLLCQDGISTAVAWGGEWVLWGDHTAAYQFGADNTERAIFDVNMRMLMHIVNSFQAEWGMEIDQPMTRAMRDVIINREQEKLDTLVAMGALLGTPRVLFIEAENPTENIMLGRFRWSIPATPTAPLKSASVHVAYTDEGFAAFWSEEELA